jgi:hypothetical protein
MDGNLAEQYKRESRASSWELIAGLAVFICIFGGSVIAAAWWIFRGSPEPLKWWEILHLIAQVLLLGGLGGITAGAGIGLLCAKLNYRRGIYRCPHCQQVMKDRSHDCLNLSTPDADAAIRSSAWHDYSRWQVPIGMAATFFLAGPLTLLLVGSRPDYLPAMSQLDTLRAYFIVCIAVTATLDMVEVLLTRLGQGERVVKVIDASGWPAVIVAFIGLLCVEYLAKPTG